MSKYNPYLKPKPGEHDDFVRSLTAEERAEVVQMMHRNRLQHSDSKPIDEHRRAAKQARLNAAAAAKPKAVYLTVDGFNFTLRSNR